MVLLEQLLKKELLNKSFYHFVKEFWSEADPAKLIDGDIIRIYTEFFQYMCRDWIGYEYKHIDLPEPSDDIIIIDIRENKKRICLEVPPRHTKSMIFNVAGPVWLWTLFPIKCASVSHSEGLAKQMNSKRHNIINSKKFKYYYPDIFLIDNAKDFLKCNRGGELYSINRNSFTGYGGDIIINDDLTNAETARKDKAEMENAWSYYQNTMPSRINDPNKCIIMNIQQRLAPNDIAGQIRKDRNLSSLYTFVTLPAIFQKDTYIVLPISNQVLFYKKGSFLWEERFGDYTHLRYEVGESIFQTQYMQMPIASDKTVIKQKQIITKSITEVPSIAQADVIYGSHDFPVKDKDSSDNLGSILAYKVGGNLYIQDCLESKMAYVKSVEYVRSLDNMYAGIIQVIEDTANGAVILQQLQDEIAGLQAYSVGSRSKTQRLESASLYMPNIIFVKSEWNEISQEYELSEELQLLIDRLINYPFVKHDDVVDAFSMLVLFAFVDRRYMVYGRAFDEANVIDTSEIKGADYSNIFLNKEGDLWRVCEIAIQYGEQSKLIVKRESRFKASMKEGIEQLKEFAGSKNFIIDCSDTTALSGFYTDGLIVERYTIDDFDKSVATTNHAFAQKSILIDDKCVVIKSDIENFKFSKTKDENVKYITEKDGFIACIRIALKYYGITK